MFDLRACITMGWILGVKPSPTGVTVYMANGKTTNQSWAEFTRTYRL